MGQPCGWGPDFIQGAPHWRRHCSVCNVASHTVCHLNFGKTFAIMSMLLRRACRCYTGEGECECKICEEMNCISEKKRVTRPLNIIKFGTRPMLGLSH